MRDGGLRMTCRGGYEPRAMGVGMHSNAAGRGVGVVPGALAALLLALMPALANAYEVFIDGFESPQVACIDGVAHGGIWPAPQLAGAALLGCVEIVNDGARRSHELAVGPLPVPRSAGLQDVDLDRIVLIGPGGRRWPLQTRTLSRWGRPLVDLTAPIRWLQLATVVDIPAGSRSAFAVYRLTNAAVEPDAMAVSVVSDGQLTVVDTGVAEFSLDPLAPMPIRRIRVRDGSSGLSEVYSIAPGGAGQGIALRLLEDDHSLLVDAGEHAAGSLVVDRVRWQAGEVEVLLHIDGHVDTGDSRTLCNGQPSWRRFPYSMTLQFVRGSASIGAEWQLGNACGSHNGPPEEERMRIEFFEFALPLSDPLQARALLAGGGPVQRSAAGHAGAHRSAQRPGAGSPWLRRAEMSIGGNTVEQAVFFASPMAGLQRPLSSAHLVATAAMPWLRYREPQSMEVRSGALALRFVDAPIALGKLKSLWFSGRIDLALVPDDLEVLPTAERLRTESLAALERGLVLRPTVDTLDAAAVLPPLAGGLDHAPGNAYLQYIQRKQDDTTGDVPCTDPANDVGSQWTCSRTYGMQLWPDIQFDLQFGFEENASPILNNPRFNYWDPANIELVEFLRSGQPRWLWSFALPQARLMAYTAYLNFGPRRGSNLAGHAYGSGGSGEGTWHRSGQGSADYSYNRHQALSFLLRPSFAQRDRFAAAGHAAMLRFSDDPSDNTTWAAIGRLNLQYVESLANCSMFVPGEDGVACDERLHEVLGRLIDVSLASGLMCELKFSADGSCYVGQLFMLYAWYHPILERLYLNYSHVLTPEREHLLRRALAETPRRILVSLPRLGAAIDVDAPWPNALLCTLTGPGDSIVQSCGLQPDPDNLAQNKPATLSLFARGHAYDPGLGLCNALVQAATGLHAGSDPLGNLRAVARGGWWKGAAESGQELVTAALGYGSCQ